MPKNIVSRLLRGGRRSDSRLGKKERADSQQDSTDSHESQAGGSLVSRITSRLALRKGPSARRRRLRGPHDPPEPLTEAWPQTELLDLCQAVTSLRYVQTPLCSRLLPVCSCRAAFASASDRAVASAAVASALPVAQKYREFKRTNRHEQPTKQTVDRPNRHERPTKQTVNWSNRDERPTKQTVDRSNQHLRPPTKRTVDNNRVDDNSVDNGGDFVSEFNNSQRSSECGSVGESLVSDCVLRLRMTTTDSHSNNNHNYPLRRHRSRRQGRSERDQIDECLQYMRRRGLLDESFDTGLRHRSPRRSTWQEDPHIWWR